MTGREVALAHRISEVARSMGLATEAGGGGRSPRSVQVLEIAIGDPQVQELLPATVSADRVALVGLHAWAEDDIANVAHWGIRTFSPDDLRATTQPLLDWLTATGCSRVAIHFDVDTIDSNELVLGLGAEPGGLTTAQVRRIVTDIGAVAEVVGVTVAEFIPRQVMHPQQLLTGFPLLGASTYT